MQGKLNVAIVYILVSVIAGAVGQVLLKKGMTTLGPVTLSFGQLPYLFWRIATNLHVVVGLLIYVGGVVFWLAALSRVDLSYAYPFASLSYVLMLGASWLLFGENISAIRLLGTLVVGLGVLLISRS
ncbi:MAG: EamA family transporter [Chloroflexi bacterium]|nr:EamA family transporter [Chloroflexota bacterium]